MSDALLESQGQMWKEMMIQTLRLRGEEGIFMGLSCPSGHRETVIRLIDEKRVRFFCIYDPDDQISRGPSRRCGFERIVDIERVNSMRELGAVLRSPNDYDSPMPREASAYWRGHVAYVSEQSHYERVGNAADRSVTMEALVREFLDSVFVQDRRITGILCPECGKPKGVIRVLTKDQALLSCTGNDGYAIEPRNCEHYRVITKTEVLSWIFDQLRPLF